MTWLALDKRNGYLAAIIRSVFCIVELNKQDSLGANSSWAQTKEAP